MNKVYVESRRKKLETIRGLYPTAEIIDVTSKADEPWVKFSPFYPIGVIPIPFSDDSFSMSVEGLWQGLKVFERNDIDQAKFLVENMIGLKRTVRKYGRVLGHRKGVSGDLMGYLEARKCLYIPSYNYVLNNFLTEEVHRLKTILEKGDLVLLDYETNQDVENLSKPLSHASLIAEHLMANCPS